MRNRLAVFLLGIILFPSFVFAMEERDTSVPESITILASSSLTDVLAEISRVYSKKSGISVSASYNSPSDLAHEIETGETADVFISEHELKMKDLKQQGLLDVFSVVDIVSNRLVLVAPLDNGLSRRYTKPGDIKKVLDEFSGPEFVIGDPDSTPIGILTRAAIEKIGKWKRVEPYLVRASDSRTAAYLIAQGKRVGVVYYSDAFKDKQIRIISDFPAELHDKIIYQAAVVAGENMEPARKFIEFIKGDQARKIFEKHGFVLP